MKKKIFAVALAATMVAGSTMSAFAETASELTVDAAFSANSGDEAVSGDFTVSYSFHNASADTSSNWYNFCIELFDANGNFITMRADAFGVGAGTGDYNADLGTWGEDQKTTWEGLPEDWTVWAADMANADVVATVARSGQVLTFTYDITGASGATYKFVGTTPAITALPSDLNIHLTGEKVALTNIKFSNGAPAETPSEAAPAEDTTEAAPAETKAPAETQAAAPQTGDATNVAIFALAAIAACGVVVATRKKVTE